ncbi:MAG: hypothetical protein WC819_04220 [Parcubacteria group bacterium]|jgi:hypothetical protein
MPALVKVIKKNGTMYKGFHFGSEGGLIYLINPWELTEDEDNENLMPGDHMESPVGKEIVGTAGEEFRFIQIPVVDIETIESTD